MKIIDKAKLAPTKKTSEPKTQSIYAIEINSITNKPISLSEFKGKTLLFVNVASECGFTKQYKELQTLSDTYKQNLVVIGSPCNQFGNQEPGEGSKIQEFCELNFGITFLLTEKIDVKGSKQHPLYTWLTSKALNGKKSSSVKWNFQKYLVDETGNLIDYYYSITKPMSSKITKHLK
ncbi:glutathione peroxidase [Formosa undariae]|uniref:Glutathione peroxidase n=1 Tax=Formosa undariae TaxID=1325436 RepID=A0ABV5EWM6_9FLAO